MKPNGSPPQLTWANIIGTAGFLVLLLGLGGTVIQYQFGNIKDDRQRDRELNQQNDIKLSAELLRRETEIKNEISGIRAELNDRRKEFPTQFQFQEYKERADTRWQTQADINKQAIDAYLSTKAWEAWRGERDRLISELNRRIDRLEKP